ncbi:hypothetical protein [Nonomuraea helvata]|uniref:WXG100 family type VII secretion target n=1 Tax=Nonomuraea helvata TaxID=37484 RepID=A0ABV5RSH2_9ACTN
MAPYEEAQEWMLQAKLIASGATYVLPYAAPLVGMLLMAVGDSAEQHRAAQQWLNETPVDAGPKYGPTAKTAPAVHASGVSDLAYLRNELQRLSRQIGESEEWLGRAYDSFLEKVKELDANLQKLDNNRTACGNTLKCSAAVYFALTMFFYAIAVILAGLAAWVVYMRSTAIGLGVEPQAISQVVKLHETVSKVVQQHSRGVIKASAIIAAAGVALNQIAKDLPFVDPVKVEKPKMLEAKAMWDSAKLDIIDDPQSGLDTGQFKQPSIMPEVGW